MTTGLILGFFDGVHSGHQAVIKSAVDYSDEAVLVTFKNSPAEYFSGDYEYIFPRKKSYSRLGNVKVVEFDFKEIATMPADEYIEFLINEFHPVSISTGYNHTFGFNRRGDARLLEACQQKYGYKYFCIPPQLYENETVSSTRIKKLLQSGDVETAKIMLGAPFSLEGEVIHGAQIGRTIGFPTANIRYPEHIARLPFGVFCGKVCIRDSSGSRPLNDIIVRSIVNWGMKPTVNNTKEPVVEIHIIGFEGDLYGQNIEVEILKKIRDEKKFNNLEELKTQIEKDVEECLKL